MFYFITVVVILPLAPAINICLSFSHFKGTITGKSKELSEYWAGWMRLRTWDEDISLAGDRKSIIVILSHDSPLVHRNSRHIYQPPTSQLCNLMKEDFSFFPLCSLNSNQLRKDYNDLVRNRSICEVSSLRQIKKYFSFWIPLTWVIKLQVVSTSIYSLANGVLVLVKYFIQPYKSPLVSIWLVDGSIYPVMGS